FGKDARFVNCFGDGLPFPDVIPDLLNDRAEPGRTCPGRKKIERPQDGQTRFDQCVELLIQNQEIRTAYLSPGSAAKQTTDPPATRFHGVNKQTRSEEHTSELQSHLNLVCRLLLEKKKNNRNNN